MVSVRPGSEFDRGLVDKMKCTGVGTEAGEQKNRRGTPVSRAEAWLDTDTQK